jgi:hypothetical protein
VEGRRQTGRRQIVERRQAGGRKTGMLVSDMREADRRPIADSHEVVGQTDRRQAGSMQAAVRQVDR